MDGDIKLAKPSKIIFWRKLKCEKYEDLAKAIVKNVGGDEKCDIAGTLYNRAAL